LYVNRLISLSSINNPLSISSNIPFNLSNHHPRITHFQPCLIQFANITPYSGTTAAGFGAVAGIFALFFFADVPKVRKDIMQKIPFIGNHFVKEIAPEDNPF
jgi:hypothetical protein